MKKLFFIMVLIVGLSAQEKSSAIFGGVNMASWSSDGAGGPDSSPSFKFGLRFLTSESFHVGFEYARYGVEDSQDGLGVGLFYDYLMFNPEFVAPIGENSFIHIGPSIGYLVSETVEVTFNGNSVSGDSDTGADIRLAGRAGLSFQIGDGVLLDIAYELAFSNLVEDDAGNTKLNAFSASLGILF